MAENGQTVTVMAVRHLAAKSLHEQLRELVAGSKFGRTTKPVLHIHIDPPVGHDTTDVISCFMRHMEKELGLSDQPRLGVLHRGKNGSGRLHAHVVYGVVRSDGRTVDLRNSFRRREKCAVLVAVELGLPPPPIPRPRSILAALLREGNRAAADWMLQQYPDLQAPPRIAQISPKRRDVAARTRTNPDDLRELLASAWPPVSPFSFRAILAAEGVSIAMGDKAVVVVDKSGTPHSLARELAAACRALKRDVPRAADIRFALKGMHLPSLPQLKKTREMAKDISDRKSADFKLKIAQGIVGEAIVADYGSLMRAAFPQEGGASARLMMADGGWLEVDTISRILIPSGPIGHSDNLAARLAELEDYEIVARRGGRRRRALGMIEPHIAMKGIMPSEADRLDWWIQFGFTPYHTANGIAVVVGGTRLVDHGDKIEFHDHPPSAAALIVITEFARINWAGSLSLTPGTVDWSEAEKGRLWLACKRNRVHFAGFIPSAELSAAWQKEQEGESGGGVPPQIGGMGGPSSNAQPLPDESNRRLQPAPLGEIETALANVNASLDELAAQWQIRGADIEQLRTQLAQLEQRKALLERAYAIFRERGLSQANAIAAARQERADAAALEAVTAKLSP